MISQLTPAVREQTPDLWLKALCWVSVNDHKRELDVEQREGVISFVGNH